MRETRRGTAVSHTYLEGSRGMQACGNHIAKVRTLVAPRTAYAVSGKSAKQAVLYCSAEGGAGFVQVRRQLIDALLQTKEFDHFIERSSANARDDWTSDGQVTLALLSGEADSQTETSALTQARALVASQQSPLVVVVLLPPHSKPSSFPADDGRLVHNVEDFGGVRVIATFANPHAAASSSSSSATTSQSLGSHGQPSVQSRRQFAYLWGAWQAKHSGRVAMPDSGKERVLQRLAGRSIGPSDQKISTEEWDRLVQSCLDQGLDDFGIYNAIRVRTLGSSLEQDLQVHVGAGAGEAAGSAAAPSSASGADESEGGEGRAGFMVKMTLQCVPDTVRRTLAADPGAALLDYGCAEGAITAELGRQLGLPAERVYGADVRSIPAEGFTFVALPAEREAPPPPGQILPTLATGRFSLITTAMVFHHVSFPCAALLELRRLISPAGALLLREHHCATPEMAAFLDIMHGLYSLAWSQPVEWPMFMHEYRAWYRPQEAWDALCQEAGFVRAIDGHAVQSAYEQGQRSNKNKDGRYSNLTRAYYAVYLPKPGFVLPAVVPVVPVLPRSGLGLGLGAVVPVVPMSLSGPAGAAGDSKKRARSDDDPRNDDRGLGKAVAPAGSQGLGLGLGSQGLGLGLGSQGPGKEVWESKKFKGKFYSLSPTGQAVWVSLRIRESGAAVSVQHPMTAASALEFLDAQTGAMCPVSTIYYS